MVAKSLAEGLLEYKDYGISIIHITILTVGMCLKYLSNWCLIITTNHNNTIYFQYIPSQALRNYDANTMSRLSPNVVLMAQLRL